MDRIPPIYSILSLLNSRRVDGVTRAPARSQPTLRPASASCTSGVVDVKGQRYYSASRTCPTPQHYCCANAMVRLVLGTLPAGAAAAESSASPSSPPEACARSSIATRRSSGASSSRTRASPSTSFAQPDGRIGGGARATSRAAIRGQGGWSSSPTRRRWPGSSDLPRSRIYQRATAARGKRRTSL